MKRVRKIAALAFTIMAVSAPALADIPENLVRGFIGPASTNNSWAGFTVMNLIPGSALFPVASATTVFSFGFTAGSEADITNMVLYTTARGSTTITAVTPVKLHGSSAPTINLSNTSVCPVAPATATPCVVKFDSLTLTLSPANDYYFAVYFTPSDTNNSSVGAAQGAAEQSSVVGTYVGGNLTGSTVGGAVPVIPNGGPVFLMYVMNE